MPSNISKVGFVALRNNLASYLEKLARGEEVQVVNARRGTTIVILRRAEKTSK